MQDNPLFKVVYPAMAAFAGSVTALAFMRWKEMTRVEICLAVFVGFSFAMFVTPWIAHLIFGVSEADARTTTGLTYVMATGSNTILPTLVRRLNRILGSEG